ncbi:MAG: hypothetical protein WC376_03635 [Candidatus Nanoarchaeia archaeon]|jgi:hypothetical protein
MKNLHIIDSLSFGGAQTVVKGIFVTLAQNMNREKAAKEYFGVYKNV